MTVQHFASGPAFRQWLKKNHAAATELLVGFYRKDSGRGGLTYAEALDEALCFGWIDGVRQKVADDTYTIRFTPRKPRSNWSLVNVRYVERLTQLGRMQPAGTKAFVERAPSRTGVYSFEKRPEKFPPALAKIFQANKDAWTFFTLQPPGYRRIVMWWVLSAKQELTQMRRLTQLIAVSGAGRRLDLLSPFAKGKSP